MGVDRLLSKSLAFLYAAALPANEQKLIPRSMNLLMVIKTTQTWTSIRWLRTWRTYPQAGKSYKLRHDVWYGRCKLGDQLDLSGEEAKELTRQYDERVPFVKKLMKVVQDRVQNGNEEGSIRSCWAASVGFQTLSLPSLVCTRP